jgi:hypothetical protein
VCPDACGWIRPAGVKGQTVCARECPGVWIDVCDRGYCDTEEDQCPAGRQREGRMVIALDECHSEQRSALPHSKLDHLSVPRKLDRLSVELRVPKCRTILCAQIRSFKCELRVPKCRTILSVVLPK